MTETISGGGHVEDALGKSCLQEVDRWLRGLKKALPILCSSDEFPRFPVFPAVRMPRRHWDLLDRQSLVAAASRTATVLDRLKENGPRTMMEEEIDRQLMIVLAEGVLAELEDHPIWRHSPLFYLRILVVGLGRLAGSSREEGRAVSDKALLDGADILLGEAMANLEEISGLEREISLSMTANVISFIRKAWPSETARGSFERTLVRFFRFLGETDCPDYFRPCPRKYLDVVLLHGLGREVDAGSLLEILEREEPPPVGAYLQGGIEERIAGDEEGLLELYRREMTAIREFFEECRIGLPEKTDLPRIQITPLVWRAFRSSASYVAPDQFFITPSSMRSEGLMEFHREYPFITAHEAYPGHHLLDSIRMAHDRPWRRIFESPFYYEGWTCYIEGLLMELGYERAGNLENLYRRRRAWRWSRARIDLGLQLGQIDLEEATAILSRAGLRIPQARRQACRYALTPGMQMCYFFGEREIVRLRRKWEKLFGLAEFHRVFLAGGQLPLALVDKRFDGVKKEQH